MADAVASCLAAVQENPYSIIRRLELSREYAALGYPDLAAGEAYMALLLIDEVCEDGGEYHEEAFEAAVQEHGGGNSPGQTTVDWVTGQVERET